MPAVLIKRPVAFRVPRANEDGETLSTTDFRYFSDEAEARTEADALMADYQGLYVRDGNVITQDRTAVAADVMEQCARVADALADAQQATNEKYPDHAKAYDSWVCAVDNYRAVAAAIRSLAKAEAV